MADSCAKETQAASFSMALMLLMTFVAAVGVWETVAATIFAPSVSRWLTLGNGIAIACMSVAGLVVHECSCPRVVHVLEVVERPGADEAVS